MNPAVTVGVLAAGAMSAGEAAGYIVSQLIGGVVRRALPVRRAGRRGDRPSARLHSLTTSSWGATTLTITARLAGFAIEAMLAFFLVTVVLSTAVAGPRRQTSRPLAIGMTLTPQHHHGRGAHGRRLQPGAGRSARWSRRAIFNDVWLYMTAPIVGAIIAGRPSYRPRPPGP